MSKKINLFKIIGSTVAGLGMASYIYITSKTINDLEKENEELQKASSLKNKDYIKMERQLEELKDRLHEEIDSGIYLVEQINKLKLSNDDLAKIHKQDSAKLKDILLKNEEHIKQTQLLQNEINRKDSRISSLKKSIDELEEEVALISAENNSVDANVLKDMELIKEENEKLSAKCSGQTDKIRELKGEIREASNKLKTTEQELLDFKSQVKNILSSKNAEKDILKQLSKTMDRTSKKVNKSGGDK